MAARASHTSTARPFVSLYWTYVFRMGGKFLKAVVFQLPEVFLGPFSQLQAVPEQVGALSDLWYNLVNVTSWSSGDFMYII